MMQIPANKKFKRRKKVRTRPSSTMTRHQFELLLGGIFSDVKTQPGVRTNGKAQTFTGVSKLLPGGKARFVQINGRSSEAKTWHELAKKMGLI